MRKIVSLFLCVLMLCALCVPAYAEDGWRDGRIGCISLFDQPDKTFIVRKSCEVSKFSVEFATLIIDKGVTVTVDGWTDICAAQIILLGTLDISKCWEIDDYKADVIVLDSGKFITNEEVDESIVTHSEHFYINNKCVDCGEDKPFIEVDPYKDEPRVTIGDFGEGFSIEDVYIIRESCEIPRLDVYCPTLIIDKGVTVTVSDIIDSGISRCKIILLGTLDISSCWGVYDDMADVIVMDSGKFIANEEGRNSTVTHSEHFYINNKCVDCGEDKPFVEVDLYKDEPRGWVTIGEQDEDVYIIRESDEDVYIIRKSCEIKRLDVYCSTLIIDKGVTVTVSDIIDSGISRCKIILLGTLDISSCWGVYDDMADVIVMDSGKFIANEEESHSTVTHSEHFYINNKCLDCGEDEPFIEVDPYKDDPPLTASVFSEYSLPVIVGISSAVVFGVGGFFLGRKKKKQP